MVKLLSSDNVEFNVEKDCILRSVLIRNLIIDIETNEELVIPLTEISSRILEIIIEYTTHYRFNEDELDDVLNEEKKEIGKIENIDDWDQKLFDRYDHDTIFEIIKASSYMDVKGLLHVGCQIIANYITGKPVEEIKTFLGLDPNEDYGKNDDEEVVVTK